MKPGSRLLLHDDGRTEGGLGDDAADRAVREAAAALLDGGDSEVRDVFPASGKLRVFIEVLEPPPRLVVCGAGHDAIPLVRFAAALGWSVDVVDDRRPFLSPDRFPEARRFVRVDGPAESARAAGVDRRTHVMVMSHNYLRDKDYVRAFLRTPVAYIGVLGPRARLEMLLSDLAAEGVHPSEEDRSKIHGPAGLDLGAEAPEEIAWAIVAEILAVRRGRRAGFLRDRAGPIHGRPGWAAGGTAG